MLAETSLEAILYGMINFQERITVSPEQCSGRPCIRGMRIRVKDILELLSEGVPEAEILQDYPYLESDDIRASLAYAASRSDHPILKTP